MDLREILLGDILEKDTAEKVLQVAFEKRLIQSYAHDEWKGDDGNSRKDGHVRYVWDMVDQKQRKEYEQRQWCYLVYKQYVAKMGLQWDPSTLDQDLQAELWKYDLNALHVKTGKHVADLQQMWDRILFVSSIRNLQINKTDDLDIIDKVVARTLLEPLQWKEAVTHIVSMLGDKGIKYGGNVYRHHLEQTMLRHSDKTIFPILKRGLSEAYLDSHAQAMDPNENSTFFLEFYRPSPIKNTTLLARYLERNDMKSILFLEKHKCISTLADILHELLGILRQMEKMKETKPFDPLGFTFGSYIFPKAACKFRIYFEAYLKEQNCNTILLFRDYQPYVMRRCFEHPLFTPLHYARAHGNPVMFDHFLKYCDKAYFERTKYMVGFVFMMDEELTFIPSKDSITLSFETGPASSFVDHKNGTYTFTENNGLQKASAHPHQAKINPKCETRATVTRISKTQRIIEITTV